MQSDYERVTDPLYLSDVAARPIGEIRSMRDECQALENAASYVRRFVQGRLDMVAAARSGDAVETPADISSAISPDTSAATTARTQRPQQDMLPDMLPTHLLEQLDEIISSEDLVRVNTLGDAELALAFDDLTAFEQRVSTDRRLLHEIIDTLQAEIVRRYRTGEATVDSLLA